MFFFLLTTFDTRDCYYFESNPSLVFLFKAFLAKKGKTTTQNVVLLSSKSEEISFPNEFAFMFILNFIDTKSSEKCQRGWIWKKI